MRGEEDGTNDRRGGGRTAGTKQRATTERGGAEDETKNWEGGEDKPERTTRGGEWDERPRGRKRTGHTNNRGGGESRTGWNERLAEGEAGRDERPRGRGGRNER